MKHILILLRYPDADIAVLALFYTIQGVRELHQNILRDDSRDESKRKVCFNNMASVNIASTVKIFSKEFPQVLQVNRSSADL